MNRCPSMENTDVFRNLTNLKNLQLQNNQLEYLPIEQGLFSPLKSLEYLFLSNNQISKITKNMFKDLLKLCMLDIRNNPIDFKEADAFEGLSQKLRIYDHN